MHFLSDVCNNTNNNCVLLAHMLFVSCLLHKIHGLHDYVTVKLVSSAGRRFTVLAKDATTVKGCFLMQNLLNVVVIIK